MSLLEISYLFIMNIKEKLQMLCREKGITIKEMEAASGLRAGTVCKWDINMPSIDKVLKVARYFGVTVDDLLDAEKPAPHGSELSNKEADIIRLFRASSPETQQAMLRLLRSLEADRMLRGDD